MTHHGEHSVLCAIDLWGMGADEMDDQFEDTWKALFEAGMIRIGGYELTTQGKARLRELNERRRPDSEE